MRKPVTSGSGKDVISISGRLSRHLDETGDRQIFKRDGLASGEGVCTFPIDRRQSLGDRVQPLSGAADHTSETTTQDPPT
jgi:hypothetical protein